MSDELASYTFLPWLRQGLANNILSGDNDPSVKLRASVPIELTLSHTDLKDVVMSDTSKIEVAIYGPGDIVGIDSKAIIKKEPRNRITNFEANYLPYIEFYEEDFPWRYTPAKTDNNKLRPWLTLVVLKVDEFDDNLDSRSKPLPSFKLKGGNAKDIFPKPSQLWAWAHVHVNTDLSKGAAPVSASALGKNIDAEVSALIIQNPDRAYSRIVSPRKLESNTAYHAFLIPTFESGRLAGLGKPLGTNLTASKCGWEDANDEFPYYHRWNFRTGDVGDFEYLVNLLKPKPADKSVGVRDMDVLHPGSNLPAIDDDRLKGILKMGGALRVPLNAMLPKDREEAELFDKWDENELDPAFIHPFVSAMADRINLADSYLVEDSTDPVITSPLYGRWHALQQRLMKDRKAVALPNTKNWVHELNLDPRFRASAGIGTKVVQKNQEEYMQNSWEQIGKVIEANNQLRLAQMAMVVSTNWYTKHFIPLAPERAFVMTTAVQSRIIYNNQTVYSLVKESMVAPALLSGTFRSITRNRGRFMKQLDFTEGIHADNLIERVNDGKVTIVEPKGIPAGGITYGDLETEEDGTSNVPPLLANFFKKYWWFKYLPLLLLFLFLLLLLLFFGGFGGSAVFVLIAVGLIWLYRKFMEWDKAISAASGPDVHSPNIVDGFDKYPNFSVQFPEATGNFTKGTSDSLEASNFKQALRDALTVSSIQYPPIERPKLDLADLSKHIIQSINPQLTIPKRTWASIKIPDRIRKKMVGVNEVFTPVMYYPVIDTPMYEPLVGLSSDLFLPNINKIEENSITLLENNQKFIESYMVGINHEMSRELLWREFPTDMRGTYFRQFWDISSVLPASAISDETRDSLRDIPAIHRWPKLKNPLDPLKFELGQHNQRAGKNGKAQLVLVIRGELLKKYPTAVVYAHRAAWGMKDGVVDFTLDRNFIELTTYEKKLETPPKEKIKMPLFKAKVDPDIYFLGFDLDVDEVKGVSNPTSIDHNAGWFFVIKERPGEPRFGMDIEKTKDKGGVERFINWNNLSWKHVGTKDGGCIELKPGVSLDNVPAGEIKPVEDDKQARWGDDSSSAELAYILYQVPVLVGVHASRMLP